MSSILIIFSPSLAFRSLSASRHCFLIIAEQPLIFLLLTTPFLSVYCTHRVPYNHIYTAVGVVIFGI